MVRAESVIVLFLCRKFCLPFCAFICVPIVAFFVSSAMLPSKIHLTPRREQLRNGVRPHSVVPSVVPNVVHHELEDIIPRDAR